MVKEKKEGKLKDNNKDNQVKVIYGKENLQEMTVAYGLERPLSFKKSKKDF